MTQDLLALVLTGTVIWFLFEIGWLVWIYISWSSCVLLLTWIQFSGPAETVCCDLVLVGPDLVCAQPLPQAVMLSDVQKYGPELRGSLLLYENNWKQSNTQVCSDNDTMAAFFFWVIWVIESHLAVSICGDANDANDAKDLSKH